MPDVVASEGPEAYGRLRGSGFWTVAFAFLIVMAVATLPGPLYGLYRTILSGLVLLVVSVRLSALSLALFLIAGALIRAGSGAVFKGTSGIVLAASPPEGRVAMTSDLRGRRP